MPARHIHKKSVILTALLGVAWLLAVAFGLRLLLDYESTPGSVSQSPPAWPADSAVSRWTAGATLVMLAHPRCPCTSASIAELAQIMADGHTKVQAYVLFLKPGNSDVDWDETPLRNKAAAIPGVTVIPDFNGTEAQRFGAETSGHTLLFAADGRLLFSGGITQARGHAGGNAGETAILALINNLPAERTSTRVFGCSFIAPTET